ncbi:MAG: hypothetical protein H7061_11620 [Bdellovibrionaceae bacterium]|nr:hypothetical protein [Bdellovibrio sp.]
MLFKLRNVKKVFSLALVLVTITAQAETVLKIKAAGRRPASNIKYRQSGVPAFDLVQKKGGQVYKVKEIPKLDIGQESEIAAAEFKLSLPPPRDLKLPEVAAKKSPDMVKIPEVKVLPIGETKKIVDESKMSAIPPVAPLNLVNDPLIATPEVTLVNLVEITPDEFKMLQALIFLEYQKKYDLAMSLFVELMEKPDYRTQALYHYAETAFGMGLYSEFRQKMIQVTKETKDLTLKKLAVENLVKNVSALETTDIALIDPLVEAFDLDITTNDTYLLKQAKHYAKKGDLGRLENALSFITPKSPLYPESLLLKAIFNYRQGKVEEAITDLETSWPLIEDKKKDAMRNLSALTLARLYFQKGDYPLAYKTYLKIDKSSPSWLQGMVEQAWTQILAGDNEGAAGNMFSLHTDFFRKAYAPDTYIVRTVGYLNLCQFGDGMNVLNDLKKRYAPVQEKLEAFQKNNQDPVKYYELVKTWLKNSDQQEVEGVPRSFIVELARHPVYTSLQKQLNNYEDENSKFNKITIDLIRKEREARLKMLQAKNSLSVMKREGASSETLRRTEQTYLAVGVEHMIISRAREGIKKMRLAAIERLDKEKDMLRTQAAKNLQARFGEFITALNHLVDQKEVLSYEIYSGAGEHIRYQMAGGEIKERAPTALKPEDDESYKWKFKGEVWEDEIGHYRSSLKNVCAPDDTAALGGI